MKNQCDKVLNADKSCSITVTPDAKTMGSPFASLVVTANSLSVLDKTLLTTVGDTLGHFVFKDSHGDEIKSLNLKGDITGTIQLANIGSTEIKGMSVLLPSAIKDYFSGCCLQQDQKLEKNSSC